MNTINVLQAWYLALHAALVLSLVGALASVPRTLRTWRAVRWLAHA